MSLFDYKNEILNNINNNWLKILDVGLDNILKSINTDLTKLCPNPSNIFSFARDCNLEDIKVVIIGQDPYPSEHAHGLAFSSLQPKSLSNIFKCLKANSLLYKLNQDITNNLTNWSKQGVLLLNKSLTTEHSIINKHNKIWNKYTNHLIKALQNRSTPLIFLLWGNYAKKLKVLINDKHHIIMEWRHPSPLAQRKDSKNNFIYCDHFININKILLSRNEDPIVWDPRISTEDINKKSLKIVIYKFMKNLPNSEIIFTDGSNYSGNPKYGNKKSKNGKGGYSLIFPKKKIIYGNLKNDKLTSNIRAEGMAIYYCLEYMNSNKIDNMLIITDSQFWIDMYTNYMPKWHMNNLNFNTKKNPDITISSWELYQKLLSEKKIIKFIHIRSHDKDGYSKYNKKSIEYIMYDNNRLADEYADKGRKNLNNGEVKCINI